MDTNYGERTLTQTDVDTIRDTLNVRAYVGEHCPFISQPARNGRVTGWLFLSGGPVIADLAEIVPDPEPEPLDPNEPDPDQPQRPDQNL